MPVPANICVVLPCYNEGVAIHDVVLSFRQALPDARIVVFDNNSQDNTPSEAVRAGAEVRRVPLQGKGNVVRRMFADVDADIYVMADGDGTYDAAVAPQLVRHLVEQRLDMLVGRRVSVENDTYRAGHVLGNWMLTTCAATLFGRSFQDMLSGYRVFSRRFAKSFPAQSQGFEIETELTVHALRLRLPVAEVDTKYFARPEGSHSKLSTYRDGFRILWMIARLLKSERPLALFGAVAVLCGLLSVGLATPIWLTFLETGLVPRLPTAVLCAALAVVAVVALVCGILLDAVTAGRLEARHATYLAAGEPISSDHLPPAIAAAPVVSSSRSVNTAPPQVMQRAMAMGRALTTAPAIGVMFALCVGVIAAVFMRQDFSWDLQNYHLYNAWSFLNDRLHVDLAPAMFQSYFNPLLDVPHYWLSVSLNWNARWVAFVAGCFQGLAGFAVYLIARRVLVAGNQRSSVAVLLAAAGCVAYSFMMELGTSMGDATVAVPTLAALAIIVALATKAGRPPLRWIAIAGVLVGAASGLKLTAAPYAVALVIASLWLPADTLRTRVCNASVLSFSVAVGVAITGGWWYWRMWTEFGNPLFPQFNHWFHAPLAAAIGYGDANLWQPRSLLEAVTFPFVIVGEPTRISELKVQPLLWPLLYVLSLIAALFALRRRLVKFTLECVPQRNAQRIVVAFVAAAYVTWMFVFGIYRYTVALELLMPLAAWILIGWLPVPSPLRGLLRAMVIAVAAWALVDPVMQDRVDFARKSYRVQAPLIEAPERTTILLVGIEPAGWVLPFFPKGVSAIGLSNNFPESPAYVDRAKQLMASRDGDVLALIVDATAERLPPFSSRFVDTSSRLKPYGRVLDANACRSYTARIGQRDAAYHLCRTDVRTPLR